jgi:hypothetical protein
MQRRAAYVDQGADEGPRAHFEFHHALLHLLLRGPPLKQPPHTLQLCTLSLSAHAQRRQRIQQQAAQSGPRFRRSAAYAWADGTCDAASPTLCSSIAVGTAPSLRTALYVCAHAAREVNFLGDGLQSTAAALRTSAARACIMLENKTAMPAMRNHARSSLRVSTDTHNEDKGVLRDARLLRGTTRNCRPPSLLICARATWSSCGPAAAAAAAASDPCMRCEVSPS